MGNDNAKGYARSDDAFAAALRVARERAKMTQEELAKEMTLRGFDFHQQTIYKIESGKRRVTVGEGVALSDLLGVSLDVMTEVDSGSLRALAMTARSSADDYVEQLISIAYQLGQIRSQDFKSLRHYVEEHDRTLRYSIDENKPSAFAQDKYWPLLSFTGINDFSQAWREFMERDETVQLLESLGYGEEDIDEARRSV